MVRTSFAKAAAVIALSLAALVPTAAYVAARPATGQTVVLADNMIWG